MPLIYNNHSIYNAGRNLPDIEDKTLKRENIKFLESLGYKVRKNEYFRRFVSRPRR